jgi:hypothetical protein
VLQVWQLTASWLAGSGDAGDDAGRPGTARLHPGLGTLVWGLSGGPVVVVITPASLDPYLFG